MRALPGGEDATERQALAWPLIVDERLFGVVAIAFALRPEAQLRVVMRRLEWGCAWLENLVRRGNFGSRERLVTALDVTALSLEHPRFRAAATAVVTELATQLDCEWVALGLLRGRHVRVAALSHSAEFGERSNLLRAVAAAMEEAVDQHAVLVYPADSEQPPRVTRGHQELSRQHGSGAFCTVPFSEADQVVGALMLKRPTARPFDVHAVEFCRHVSALVGPVMTLKRRDDLWLTEKPKQAVGALLERLFGPRHTGFKLAAAASAALIVFLAVAEGDYRITADAVLEGTVQRAVTAPMDGYVVSAAARAGDVVKAGDELFALDDKDLQLERVKWVSRREQYLSEYIRALAERDRAQVRILSAQIAQADAELELVDEQLERTRQVAPFEGVVVSGDLSQSLGVPVQRGQVLFELAPLDSYRVILEVDEREIREVVVGQLGTLTLAGLPGETLPLKVVKITPVSTVEEGRNFFRVEARLEKPSALLRPGMQGVGKVYVDRRKELWIRTHKLKESVRLWWWSWWG